MSPQPDAKLRAWVEARIDEHGSIDGAWPRDQCTARAWRELCKHLGVATNRKARSLDEALTRLAQLAD